MASGSISTKKDQECILWKHGVSGMCAGAASTLILHPLDLIKVRFQGKLICAKWMRLLCSSVYTTVDMGINSYVTSMCTHPFYSARRYEEKGLPGRWEIAHKNQHSYLFQKTLQGRGRSRPIQRRHSKCPSIVSHMGNIFHNVTRHILVWAPSA